MLNLQKLPIRHQLSALIAAALLFISATAGVGWWSLRLVGGIADTLHHVDAPRLEATNDLVAAVTARAIAARNLVLLPEPAARARQVNTIERSHQATEKAIASMKRQTASLPPQDPARPLLQAVYDAEAEYGPVALEITRIAASGDNTTATRLIAERCEPLLRKLLDAVDALQTQMTRATDSSFERLDQADAQAEALVAALGLVSVLLLVSGAGRAVQAVEQMAEGDLTAELQVHGRSEPDQVLGALNHMRAKLQDTLSAVQSASSQIGTASAEVASGANDLSSRTEQAASNLEETASSMEEITSTVQQTSDSARKAAQLASHSAEVAKQAGDVVGRVVENMREIDRHSSRISEIIGVIDGIAFQTNILALNAAVEAARAGEQGRGFAVVASEVRNLAQRSANAAKEIKQLIDTSSAAIASGSALVDESGRTIASVVQNARGVNDIVAEIMAAAAEQAEGIAQVNAAVSQMDGMTQQNAALVEESSAAAEHLRVQAENLLDSVAYFRLQAGSTPNRAQPAAARPAGRPTPLTPARVAAPRKAPARALPATARVALAGAGAHADDWTSF
jgi:methyl-accepting chemotaxis protein